MPRDSKISSLFGTLASAGAVIGTLLLFASWLSAVNAYDGRISDIKKQADADHLAVLTTLPRMDYNIQIIARKVGVTPLSPASVPPRD